MWIILLYAFRTKCLSPPVVNILFFLDGLNFPYKVEAVYHFLISETPYKSQRVKGHSTMGQWENGKFNSLSKINKKGLLLGETLT